MKKMEPIRLRCEMEDIPSAGGNMRRHPGHQFGFSQLEVNKFVGAKIFHDLDFAPNPSRIAFNKTKILRPNADGYRFCRVFSPATAWRGT